MTAKKINRKKESNPINSEVTQIFIDEIEDAQNEVENICYSFPIIGIGASAGGLMAFEEFFAGIPDGVDTGMAFVLVQHLDPKHKSILADIIGKYVFMKVFEVTNGMIVEPNCVYIIPPNRDMSLFNGTLQLHETQSPYGLRQPIDFLFCSLAQELREKAICILLSGTGSDGTQGVRAVKRLGGMVMVQNNCEYDGMPHSAISTGMVDYECRAIEMFEQIIEYVGHPFGNPNPNITDLIAEPENEMKKIFILMREQTGNDFSLYKSGTIHRRILRRMAINKINTMEAYVRYLQQAKDEVEALFRDFLIGVTSFFRDKEAFKNLEENIIPKLFSGKSIGSVVRVWVTGCSTGEEAYSIAILLQEHLESLKQRYTVQVFASDIDVRAIATARIGIFPVSIAKDITQERLERFFVFESNKNEYRICKTIREMLVFSPHNVIKDPPFSKIDMISCRNLMIYLSGDLQKKLMSIFHYALNANGMLFLGSSETIGDFANLFAVLDRKLKIYQKKEDLLAKYQMQIDRETLPIVSARERVTIASKETSIVQKQPLRQIVEQTLLAQIEIAAVLVKGNGDILYLHGRTGMYLEPTPGEVGINNIIKMGREGLRHELSMGMRNIVHNQEIVRYQNLRVKTNGHFTFVNMTIRPVLTGSVSSIETQLYLVILEQTAHTEFDQAQQAELFASAAMAPVMDSDTNIMVLKQELKNKEEYLHAANEELMTSNEELKCSKEEMQSVNEELQSTNEELETSKEELQSINEELATVNLEMQNKMVDLWRINNDMNNLLSGSGIATIFVDHKLRILRFTPTVEQIIHLIPSDMGRPVEHITNKLIGYDNLLADMHAVLNTLIPKELNVQTSGGKTYTMRIQPYRTLENVIEGAVITFVDITEMKRKEPLLKELELQFQIFIEQAPVAIAVSRDALGLYANKKFIDTFRFQNVDEFVGRPLIEYYAPQCRDANLMHTLRITNEQSLATEIETFGLKVDGTQFPMHVVIAPIKLIEGIVNITFVTDISARKTTG